MDIKEVLPLWFIKFLIKSLKVVVLIKKIKQNEQLAEELNKPIITNLYEEKYIHHL